MEVTDQELIQAMVEALQVSGDESGVTTNQLVEAMGISVKRVRRGLHILKRQGRLDVVWVAIEALDGRLTRVRGYKLKNDKSGNQP